MELINHVNDKGFESLYNDSIKINTFKNLKLLKYKYDSKINKDYLKYCKGAIYNTDTNKFVCIPPKRSDEYNNQKLDNSFIIQDLVDGTMINIFYTNEKWCLSTRSDIGGKNKWSDKSFFELIKDICEYESITKLLNPDYSYSFVLRHKSNKCVSNIEFNSLVLVDIFDFNRNMYVINMFNHFNNKNIPFWIVNHYTYTNVDRLINLKCNHDWKGFIIKNNNLRYKYINPEYKKAKDITNNSNNLLHTYFSCIHDSTLMKYLKIHPEHKTKFNSYKNMVDIMINELYSNYCNLKIHKTIEYKNIPFHLKPLINEIHDEYVIKHKKINKLFIKKYFTKLPIKRILFVMNNYIY